MTQKIETTSAVTFAADGNGATQALPYMSASGSITAFATGTFGSGTLKVQVSADGTNWYDSGVTGITVAGILKITGLACRFIRPVLTGSTAPSISVVFCY